MGREIFWLDQPAIFFNNWYRFVPTNDMTIPEALNSILRFTIYSAILISIISKNANYLLLIPIVMFVSVLLVRMYPRTQILKEAFTSAKDGVDSPTTNNPFMNVLFTDYVDNPQKPPAPKDVTLPAVRDNIMEAFSKTNNLFLDTNDRFGLAQSARNWVSQPSTTIPNDLEAFQNFLNKDNTTQKLPSEGYVLAKGSVSAIPDGQYQYN